MALRLAQYRFTTSRLALRRCVWTTALSSAASFPFSTAISVTSRCHRNLNDPGDQTAVSATIRFTQRTFISSTNMPHIPEQTVTQLQRYTACDISDALLKLKVPGAGFIADLNPYSAQPGEDAASTVIAPVSTFLFVPKDATLEENEAIPSNIPKDKHWVDMSQPGTFVVMKQPPGQTNAICGGIMAVRMKVLKVKGILVAGRVRDLDELRSTELPIWAYGTSTVGSGASSAPWAAQTPLEINGVTVNPGDIAFSDPFNGTVIIPSDKIDQVLELLPALTAADDKVKEDVLKGMSVKDAFKLHRG